MHTCRRRARPTPSWPVHKIAITNICLVYIATPSWPSHKIAIINSLVYIAILGGRMETMYCAIVWAIKGAGGVATQRGCLHRRLWLRTQKPRNQRISKTVRFYYRIMHLHGDTLHSNTIHSPTPRFVCPFPFLPQVSKARNTFSKCVDTLIQLATLQTSFRILDEVRIYIDT